MNVQAIPAKSRTGPEKIGSQGQKTVKEDFLSILKERADSKSKTVKDEKMPVRKAEKKEEPAKKTKNSADNGEFGGQIAQESQSDSGVKAEEAEESKVETKVGAENSKSENSSELKGLDGLNETGEDTGTLSVMQNLIYQNRMVGFSDQKENEVFQQKNGTALVQDNLNEMVSRPENENQRANPKSEFVKTGTEQAGLTEMEKQAKTGTLQSVYVVEQGRKTQGDIQANRPQPASELQPEVIKLSGAEAGGENSQSGTNSSGKNGDETSRWFSLDHTMRGERPGGDEKSLGQTESQTSISLEDLQKKAQQNGILPFERMIGAKLSGGSAVQTAGGRNITDATPLPEQLKAGIEQGLSKQLSQFTIRLKPEGLGEILVQMTSSGGKIALSIGVSNHETQKLLSAEMMHLKETLEPLHAEVQEIYHNSQGGMEMMSYEQGFFQNQQRDTAGTSRGRAARTSGVEDEALTGNLEAEGITDSRMGYGRLSAYI